MLGTGGRYPAPAIQYKFYVQYQHLRLGTLIPTDSY